MKFNFNSKYTTIAAYALIVFAICLLLVSFVFRFDEYSSYVRLIFDVLSPIIWGFVLAYLLNPITKFLEKYLSKLICKNKPHRILIRSISIALTILIVLALIALLIAMAIPELLKSLEKIFKNFSPYMNTLQNFTQKFLKDNPRIEDIFKGELDTIRSYLMDLVSNLQPFINNLKNGAFSFLSGITDFLLGLIVSVYLLYNKETYIGQAKKIMYASLSIKKCNKLLALLRKINTVFINFITGKLLDSFIVGVCCFIGMTILDMPYIVLITFIIAIANFIPFFGPIIGAIPSILLIFVEDPKKALVFSIFILVLMQIDGNIIEPKILGDSLGVSTFWILFAIFLGGGLFGFIGMILFVPLFTVFYAIIKELVTDKLKSKNLPLNTSEYIKDDLHEENNDN